MYLPRAHSATKAAKHVLVLILTTATSAQAATQKPKTFRTTLPAVRNHREVVPCFSGATTAAAVAAPAFS